MANPFIGQIVKLAFNWAPVNYSLCNGATQLISQNTALYSLIGTTFGGDGRTTYDLPDLRGKVPISYGYPSQQQIQYSQGSFGGFESITLTHSQMAAHNHNLGCTNADGDFFVGEGRGFARASPRAADTSAEPAYTGYTSNLVALNSGALPTSAGSGQAHNNMQPSLVINIDISLQGDYPSRN